MPSWRPPMHICAITTACVAELPAPPIHVLPADGSGVWISHLLLYVSYVAVVRRPDTGCV